MKLPIYFPPEKDEMLYSWLEHLKRKNGISSMQVFWSHFVDPEHTSKHFQLKKDGRVKIIAIHNALCAERDIADLYSTTTCYDGLAPFLSREHQNKQVSSAFRQTERKDAILRTPHTHTPALKRCPQCMIEDREKVGDWYVHRAHQFMGVTVCYKHGCILERFSGKEGREFDANADYKSVNAPVNLEAAQRMAQFAKDLLDMAVDTSMEETKTIFMTAIKEQGYYNPEADYKKLELDLDESGMGEHFPRGIAYYLKEQLSFVSNAPVESSLALASFLFGNAVKFAAACARLQMEEPSKLPEQFKRIGPRRRNLLQLQCNVCGCRFCTTEAAVMDGWGCPQCDEALTSTELFARIVQFSGKGEYTLLSQYVTADKEVLMRHSCGREYMIKPRRFVHDGNRCTCEDRKTLAEVKHKIDNIGDYSLMCYDMKKENISVVGNDHDEYFTCNLSDMDNRPWLEDFAPRFEGTHDIFVRRVADLVGDEYSVVDEFTGYRNKVRLRHNNCGHEQEYYAHNFLAGQRCKLCRSWNVPEYLRVIIPKISKGEYRYGGSLEGDMVIIENIRTDEKKALRADYALQELFRPTPSRVLPLGLPKEGYARSQAIEDREFKFRYPMWWSFWEMLKEKYVDEKFIFLDEFKTDEDSYQNAKHALAYLADDHGANHLLFLKRAWSGIYTWAKQEYTPEEMLFAKYCKRKDGVIGYAYGQSFAFALGLTSQVPDMLYFTTMKEASTHGRALRKIKGVHVYVRAPKAPISDDNYKVLQLLDLLPNLGQYIECSRDEAIAILRKYAFEQGITKEDAASYLHLYPEWVNPLVDAILA